MYKVILVVDDEPLILDLTASMLEELGCEVLAADNGEDALARLAQDPRVSLMIADVQACPAMSLRRRRGDAGRT